MSAHGDSAELARLLHAMREENAQLRASAVPIATRLPPTEEQKRLASVIDRAMTRSPEDERDVVVSVIMAAYNGERLIAESIRSVLDQTFKDLELIVIDDGSTDGTAAVVQGLAAQDPRVVYVHQQNGRQGKARNNGIRRARGETIAFIDQDDLWVANKLEVQLTAMAREHADVVFSDGFLFRDSAVQEQWKTFETIVGRFDGREMFRLGFVENRIPVLSALVRKGAIVDAGMITEDPARQGCDDYDLWLKLAARGSVFLGLKELLVRYRVHAEQASADLPKMLEREIHVLEDYRHTRLVDAEARRRRFSLVYGRLVIELLEVGDTARAAQWLDTWAIREQAIWPRLLARTLNVPGARRSAQVFLHRIVTSTLRTI